MVEPTNLSEIREINLDKHRNYTPEIQDVLQYDGNSTCADCLSKSMTFCSKNKMRLDVSCVDLRFYVIICEKCAAVHINYGFEARLLSERNWEHEILNVIRSNWLILATKKLFKCCFTFDI